MPNFGTRYGERQVFYTNPGSPIKTEYVARYDENGALELVPNGERNIFQDIQMYKDECDIHLLLKRFAAGEVDVLSRVQGFYADVSEFPATYPEFFNLISRSREFFDSLPVDVKSKFGNNFESFLAASQSPDFLTAFVKSVPESENGDASDES